MGRNKNKYQIGFEHYFGKNIHTKTPSALHRTINKYEFDQLIQKDQMIKKVVNGYHRTIHHRKLNGINWIYFTENRGPYSTGFTYYFYLGDNYHDLTERRTAPGHVKNAFGVDLPFQMYQLMKRVMKRLGLKEPF